MKTDVAAQEEVVSVSNIATVDLVCVYFAARQIDRGPYCTGTIAAGYGLDGPGSILGCAPIVSFSATD
jgi:hypothetical protein